MSALSTAVLDAGAGSPVLLLHGIPTSGALWSGVVPPLLAAGHRVIVPDLPGWGDSAPLSGPPTPEAHLRWIRELMSRHSVERPVVAGHDLGGLLGLMLAAEGLATGVTLTSSWAGLGWMGARVTALPVLERLFYRRYGGRLYIRRGSAPDRMHEAVATFGPALADPGVVPRMRSIAAAFEPAMLARLPARVRSSGTPVRCIWGRRDPFIPRPLVPVIAAQLGGRVVWLDGASHLAPFDRPGPMAEALLAFVRDLEADSGGHRPEDA